MYIMIDEEFKMSLLVQSNRTDIVAGYSANVLGRNVHRSLSIYEIFNDVRKYCVLKITTQLRRKN